MTGLDVVVVGLKKKNSEKKRKTEAEKGGEEDQRAKKNRMGDPWRRAVPCNKDVPRNLDRHVFQDRPGDDAALICGTHLWADLQSRLGIFLEIQQGQIATAAHSDVHREMSSERIAQFIIERTLGAPGLPIHSPMSSTHGSAC